MGPSVKWPSSSLIGTSSDLRDVIRGLEHSRQQPLRWPSVRVLDAPSGWQAAAEAEAEVEAEEVLTVVGAAMEFEAEANCAQVLAVGQDSDHICAHNWRRQFVSNHTIDVLVGPYGLLVFVGVKF